MGVPAEAAAGQGVLPEVHQVDEQGEGSLQVGRLEGRLEAVGVAQEQAGHELRDDGQGAEVLLPEGDFGEGGRAEVGLPVRGRPEGHRGDRLYGGVTAGSHDQSGVIVADCASARFNSTTKLLF